jgi:protein SCO1/2
MRVAPHAAKRALATAFSCALLALLLASCGSSKRTPQAAATAVEGATAGFVGAPVPLEGAHDFTLTDPARRSVSTREYRGRVLVLAFVGTRCRAPCTVIGDQIRGALDELSRAAPVLLVSVDPAHDTPAAVARYLATVSLTGRARYLTGPIAALRAVWRAYRVPGPARGSSPYERFAPVFLLDAQGRTRVEYALEQLTPDALVHDIRALSR